MALLTLKGPMMGDEMVVTIGPESRTATVPGQGQGAEVGKRLHRGGHFGAARVQKRGN